MSYSDYIRSTTFRTGIDDNGRYTKLGRQVGKINFYIFKVRNWLRKSWYAYIICECQYLSLSVRCTKKINKIFDTNFGLIKGNAKLSLRTKVFSIFRIIGNIRYLTQCSANRNNYISSFCDRSRQGSGFFFSNKFSNIITNLQSNKICAINNRKTRWNKAFNFQVRSEWTGSDILDVVANSNFCYCERHSKFLSS